MQARPEGVAYMSEPGSQRRLQVCRRNRLARRQDLLGGLQAEACRIEFEECLDQCTRCDSRAFALVSGRFLFASSSEEFMRRIRKARRGNDSQKGGGDPASQ